MTDLFVSTVPFLKAVHFAALALWCGGLMVLPLMLARHDPAVVADDYRLIRRATHITYTACVTPAAVIAVIAGTWLIFLRGVFVPWLFAKLAFVMLLVAAHAWIGHILTRVAEEPGEHTPPDPRLPIAAAAMPVVAILVLALAKPTLSWITIPDWASQPRGDQLLLEVPSR